MSQYQPSRKAPCPDPTIPDNGQYYYTDQDGHRCVWREGMIFTETDESAQEMQNRQQRGQNRYGWIFPKKGR